MQRFTIITDTEMRAAKGDVRRALDLAEERDRRLREIDKPRTRTQLPEGAAEHQTKGRS